ncbi:hypothetical protein ACIQ7D_17935 [Streptomyces sp. NPDC096310]|uniref:hypothetical protein n=1 Tax=Streptomyces sp. NPDC096310 TaxID=3366082 RepID=UPI0038066FCF
MTATPVPQSKISATLVDPGRGEHLWVILAMYKVSDAAIRRMNQGEAPPGTGLLTTRTSSRWRAPAASNANSPTASTSHTGSARASTVNWDRIEDAEAVHGHGGHTVIVWDDPEPPAPDMNCPHCPDGHTLPDGGSQPWHAHVSDDRDGDGQPTQIIVARSAGAHVAESDAEWIRQRLNGPENVRPVPVQQSTFSRLGRGA